MNFSTNVVEPSSNQGAEHIFTVINHYNKGMSHMEPIRNEIQRRRSNPCQRAALAAKK